MANFIEAYNITLKHEGGYSYDIDDMGGETYKGIARRYYPSWEGWAIIDIYKEDYSSFPNNAYNDSSLDLKVKDFYKANYWDVNLLDECPSQPVANELFDTGVNMGISRAGRFLQKALNVLNKDGQIYPDIVEDGKVGNNTIKALKAHLSYKGDEYLYKVLNILQGMHYINYMTKSSIQEKFAFGWLKRVNFIKE